MKPLKLHLDDLAVESFSTMPQSAGRGTVRGAVYSEPGQTCADSCNECWVHTVLCEEQTPAWTACGESGVESRCYNTCAWTCEATCPETCLPNCPMTGNYTCLC
jgi:hypothetical protein